MQEQLAKTKNNYRATPKDELPIFDNTDVIRRRKISNECLFSLDPSKRLKTEHYGSLGEDRKHKLHAVKFNFKEDGATVDVDLTQAEFDAEACLDDTEKKKEKRQKVQQLQSILPHLDKASIKQALHKAHGECEAAVNILLEASNSTDFNIQTPGYLTKGNLFDFN